MTTEEWRPVSGALDYMVSNLGRVISNKRSTPHLMRPCREKAGYLKIFVSQDDGQVRQRKVHHLVAEAFIGPRPEGLEIRHLDADRANNALTNLRYGTKTENAFDRVGHGNHPMANKTHCKNGHEFTPENTKPWGPADRWRACRTCRAASSRAYDIRQAQRAAGIRTAA